MINIEIKRRGGKKSVVSLVQDEEETIVNELNCSALKEGENKMIEGLNQKIEGLNQKIEEHEKCIGRLLGDIQEKNVEMKQYGEELGEREKKMAMIIKQNSQLKKLNYQMTKKLCQSEYKLQVIQKNRAVVPEFKYRDDNVEVEIRKMKDIKNNSKREVYKEIVEVLSNKVEKFLKQLTNYEMSTELQQFISSFLDQIIHVNSKQSRPSLFESKLMRAQGKRQVGKILQRKDLKIRKQKLSEMEQWIKIENSQNKKKKVQENSEFQLSNNIQQTTSNMMMSGEFGISEYQQPHKINLRYF